MGTIMENEQPKFNEETLAAMKEIEDMKANPSKYKTYDSVEELFDDVLNEE